MHPQKEQIQACSFRGPEGRVAHNRGTKFISNLIENNHFLTTSSSTTGKTNETGNEFEILLVDTFLLCFRFTHFNWISMK